MWQCPKCGRAFGKVNQSHYCTEAGSIDDYIAAQPAEVQPLLKKLRKTIRQAAPDAVEKISYRLPTYWQGKNLVYFGGFKNHISLFPGAEASKALAKRLKNYKVSKGTIHFPLGEPIDFELVADIVRWRVKQATGV